MHNKEATRRWRQRVCRLEQLERDVSTLVISIRNCGKLRWQHWRKQDVICWNGWVVLGTNMKRCFPRWKVQLDEVGRYDSVRYVKDLVPAVSSRNVRCLGGSYSTCSSGGVVNYGSIQSTAVYARYGTTFQVLPTYFRLLNCVPDTWHSLPVSGWETIQKNPANSGRTYYLKPTLSCSKTFYREALSYAHAQNRMPARHGSIPARPGKACDCIPECTNTRTWMPTNK